MVAVFKEGPVLSRLSTIVEGESLLNDGVALVLFSLIANAYSAGSIVFLDGMQDLFVVIVGRTLVSLGVGCLGVGLSR